MIRGREQNERMYKKGSMQFDVVVFTRFAIRNEIKRNESVDGLAVLFYFWFLIRWFRRWNSFVYRVSILRFVFVFFARR